MKRYKYLLPILLVAVLLTSGAVIETSRSPVKTVRSAIAPSTDSTKSDLSWDGRGSHTTLVSDRHNIVVLSFSGNDADASVTDCEIWGYTKNDSAKLLWVGAIYAGTATDDNSRYIVDTITTTTDNTPSGVTILDSGNSRYATLRFDASENQYIEVLFPTVSASDTMSCFMTGY